MYFHLPKYLNQQQLHEILAELTPFFENSHKFLGLGENQAGTEYDLTADRAIPIYVSLVEHLCSQYTGKKVQCRNYWISVSKPGTTVVSHNHWDHGECKFSAIIYVCADQDSGQLQLEDYGVGLTLSPGDIVLFPTQCYHSVTKNNSGFDRVCVAFDLAEKTE